MEISAWTQSFDAKAMKQGEEEIIASNFHNVKCFIMTIFAQHLKKALLFSQIHCLTLYWHYFFVKNHRLSFKCIIFKKDLRFVNMDYLSLFLTSFNLARHSLSVRPSKPKEK
jgi:hypothetical protein